eukprot:CAMPEP_0177286398 /NCGR_PEP_ID=MMETSP0367-20130122/73599_1 /TAXON_ID=447022 ORGANISM="Scrippsiella hangoei-like, Strain SHHI-4" /NCGR_SAMPLE_ID=MMETSP0367 /ASSEMBLY_ACC=CAM_ASM_000362 /LENGTH=89 /DNA_ID=CAMNT_0018743637 /DNA_START=732 /DNA_END=1001 /DNA_ORIENTATION=-
MPKDSKYPPAGDKAAAPAEFLRPNMRIRHGGLTTDRPPELRPIANHDRLLHRGSDPTTAAARQSRQQPEPQRLRWQRRHRRECRPVPKG